MITLEAVKRARKGAFVETNSSGAVMRDNGKDLAAAGQHDDHLVLGVGWRGICVIFNIL